jgi:hypothetical protein
LKVSHVCLSPQHSVSDENDLFACIIRLGESPRDYLHRMHIYYGKYSR